MAASLPMPNDQNAERAVLGGLLLENAAWHECSDLQRSDFYSDAHALIFEAMQALHDVGEPIDTTTVRSKLALSGNLPRVGGDEYLLALTDTIPTISNIQAHAKIVRDRATAREVARLALRIADEAVQPIDDMPDFLDRASRILPRLIDRRRKNDVEIVTLADAMFDEYEILKERNQRGDTSIGYLTGFHDLDDQLGGFAPGDLIVVGARPGQGKTAFANECKLGVAQSSGKRVLCFELEMTRQQLVHRIWAAHVEINLRRIRAATIEPHEFRRMAEVIDRLSRLGISFVFERGLSIDDMSRIADREHREHGELGLIVTDYLQRTRGGRRFGSRDEEMGEVVQGHKTMAGRHGCPVLAISSLNREVEKRPDKHPQIADMRESGSIEFEADTILLLYRDEVYNPNTQHKGVAEINIGKQRSGASNVVVRVGFTKEFTRFENLVAYEQRSFAAPPHDDADRRYP